MFYKIFENFEMLKKSYFLHEVSGNATLKKYKMKTDISICF